MRRIALILTLVSIVVVASSGLARRAEAQQADVQPNARNPPPAALTTIATTQQTSSASQPLTTPIRLAILGGSALVLLVIAMLLFGRNFNWLVIGEDNRYSNSKFQMALWFWTLLSAYLAAGVIRVYQDGLAHAGGVDIPAGLLGLSGMSAMSFAGAKQIVVSRIDQHGGDASAVKAPSLLGARFPIDLVTDDSGHRPDFGNFQMLIITLLAVGVWLASFFHWMAVIPHTDRVMLPNVDTTILGTFGIGHAAYLAKKFAGDSSPAVRGPVINGNPPRPIR